MLVGRKDEKTLLTELLRSDEPQFVAVYGRRRVGKTFLVREAFNDDFCFKYTGAANIANSKQLSRFESELRQQGLNDVSKLCNWNQAFNELKRLITLSQRKKKVVFIDEMPWMDSARSGFLPELEVFWNGWGSARKDVVMVVCGSSTSWMVKKIIRNKGGLHNRLTHRIALKPFSLGVCEEYCKKRGLSFSREQITEGYMAFGGIPYYWSLLRRGASMSQEIERLFFNKDGELHDEYKMLYSSLFKSPEPYMKIIETLGRKRVGMTRLDLIDQTGMPNNGKVSEILDDLEWCGMIRSYSMPGNKAKSVIFQLTDHFTLFHLTFAKDARNSTNYWTALNGTPKHNTWCGLAFERVCLCHTLQIKKKLGISGILTNEYAWYFKGDEIHNGVQIDMLIDRGDDVIDLCEMKYSQNEFAISKAYAEELRNKCATFQEVTKCRKAVHFVLVTTYGLAKKGEWSAVQNVVTLDDLFFQ